MGLHSDNFIQIMSGILNIISLLGLLAAVLMFVIHYKVKKDEFNEIGNGYNTRLYLEWAFICLVAATMSRYLKACILGESLIMIMITMLLFCVVIMPVFLSIVRKIQEKKFDEKYEKRKNERVDEIQTKIINILLEKGKDAEQQVLPSNHPEYPDLKIKLDKRIDFDEPVILWFSYVQVLSVGLNINHIPDHPDHNVIYYRVKDRLGNNYWTPIGYPIYFKTDPAQLMEILDALRHVDIPTC